MPVKKDAAGNRSVEAEMDVPGTPDEVWNAIATGPGISAWFVPSELEGRTGGITVSHFASDGSMDATATITAWEPPKRFIAEAPGESGTIATEWTVEAKSGGLCTVRVVHRWFATSDDWDDQFEAHSHGWISFFRLLRLYLTRFPGQHGSAFQVLVPSSRPVAGAWKTLVESLGLANAAEQQHVSAASDGPAFEGVTERLGPQEHPEVVLSLDRPVPGFAHIFALPMGGTTFLSVRFYLFGDGAAKAAQQEEPRWRAWLEKHFPAPAE